MAFYSQNQESRIKSIHIGHMGRAGERRGKDRVVCHMTDLRDNLSTQPEYGEDKGQGIHSLRKSVFFTLGLCGLSFTLHAF